MTELTWRVENIETIANFLSAAECDDYVSWGEAIGFKDAPISTSMGMIMAKDVRNNERVMVDDRDRTQALYQRLAGHLAPSFQHRWQPVGLNERLRLYRYDVGQKFDWHRDGHFARDNGERSQFTASKIHRKAPGEMAAFLAHDAAQPGARGHAMRERRTGRRVRAPVQAVPHQ